MAATYLNHLTLTSGDLRRSPASEVEDVIVSDLADLIADILEAGEPRPIDPANPYFRPYSLAVTPYGRSLYAELRRDASVLVTMGIAPRDRDGRGLWIRLTEDLAIRAPGLPIPRCPAVPWLAVIPQLALTGDPALEWAGDFERCLAWAWLRKR